MRVRKRDSNYLDILLKHFTPVYLYNKASG
jgi:hypothetical protein